MRIREFHEPFRNGDRVVDRTWKEYGRIVGFQDTHDDRPNAKVTRLVKVRFSKAERYVLPSNLDLVDRLCKEDKTDGDIESLKADNMSLLDEVKDLRHRNKMLDDALSGLDKVLRQNLDDNYMKHQKIQELRDALQFIVECQPSSVEAARVAREALGKGNTDE